MLVAVLQMLGSRVASSLCLAACGGDGDLWLVRTNAGALDGFSHTSAAHLASVWVEASIRGFPLAIIG